jgi:DNA-binding response OmpR family regulator
MELTMLKQMHLLIVEDDEIAASFLANTLKELFKTISVVYHGEEALTYMQHHSIDVLITDLAMPCCSGIKLIQTIRHEEQQKKKQALPIVVISGRQESKELLEIVRFSLIDYVLKPLSFTRLYQALERLNLYIQSQTCMHQAIDATLFYDPLTKSLHEDNTITALTRLEAALLEVLLENRGRLLSKATLVETIYNHEVEDVTFRNLLVRLRKKLGKDRLINHKELGIKLR